MLLEVEQHMLPSLPDHQVCFGIYSSVLVSQPAGRGCGVSREQSMRVKRRKERPSRLSAGLKSGGLPNGSPSSSLDGQQPSHRMSAVDHCGSDSMRARGTHDICAADCGQPDPPTFTGSGDREPGLARRQ